MQLDRGFGDVAEQPADRARAAHPVPLVAQPPGVRRERVARIARLGDRHIRRVDEPGPAVLGREAAVFVQARAAVWRAFGEGPGLGPVFEFGVGQAGDVEVAATGRLAMFVPDRLGVGVTELRRPAGPQARFHLGHVPEPRDLGAVLRIGQIAMAAEKVGERADLAAAHRVGLPGQRERTRAAPSDLAGGQVQVDQCRVLGRAAAALVQALAIQRQRGAARAGAGVVEPGEPARGLDDVGLRNSAQRRDVLRGEVANTRLERLEAARVGGDVGGVEPPLPQHHVQHAVEQRHVGAGQDRQEQVGGVGGLGAARIDDDGALRRVRAPGVLDAAVQDRVREGGVGPLSKAVANPTASGRRRASPLLSPSAASTPRSTLPVHRNRRRCTKAGCPRPPSRHTPRSRSGRRPRTSVGALSSSGAAGGRRRRGLPGFVWGLQDSARRGGRRQEDRNGARHHD
jgi:hypothetical protein